MKNFEIQFPYWSESNAYVMNNGELTNVEIVGTAVYLNEEKSLIICKAPNGNRVELEIGLFYSDVDHYKRGESIKVSRGNTQSHLIGKVEDTGEDTFEKYFWVMHNGEPTKHYIKFSNRIEFDNSERMVSGADIPADYYDSREDCIKWNDITSVEQDGTKILHKSYYKALLLTNEQKAIVAEIADAFKRASQAGIKIGYNSCNNAWYGLNVSEHYAEFTYDTDNEEYHAVVDYNDNAWEKFLLDIPEPYYVSDDDCICIK